MISRSDGLTPPGSKVPKNPQKAGGGIGVPLGRVAAQSGRVVASFLLSQEVGEGELETNTSNTSRYHRRGGLFSKFVLVPHPRRQGKRKDVTSFVIVVDGSSCTHFPNV